MSKKEQLWCIHIPGPDDIYAAIAEYLKHNPLTKYSPSAESITAVAILWDGSKEDRAEAIKDFDPVAWGLNGNQNEVME